MSLKKTPSKSTKKGRFRHLSCKTKEKEILEYPFFHVYNDECRLFEYVFVKNIL